jgi:hypothetical protein
MAYLNLAHIASYVRSELAEIASLYGLPSLAAFCLTSADDEVYAFADTPSLFVQFSVAP